MSFKSLSYGCIALICAVFSSAVLATVPETDLVSDRVGSTAGVFRVDESGQVTYSVPLAVAPGTAGVTPEMALNYSSQGGDGVMGRGWSIAGQSSIGRCRKTREAGDFLQAADPVNTSGEPIRFSRDDAFCLDGQRLLAVSGTYGADGTEYRLELDPFTRIFSRGGNNSADSATYVGPAYFEVQRRDGSTSSYGGRDDARQRRNNCGSSACAYQSWALSRYEDSSGNYIDYDYQKLLSGSVVTGDVPSDEALLQAVRYTGKRAINGVGSNSAPYARLLFNYSLLPADNQSLGWQSGSKVAQTRQLDSVSVQESILTSAQTIRHYVLTYATSPARHHARLLHSLRECSNESQSVCYRPTTFDWLGDVAAATQTGGTANSTHLAGAKAGLRLGDVDGDGRQDIVWVDPSANGCSNGGFMVAYGAHTVSLGSAQPTLEMPIQQAVCSPRALADLEDSWHLIDYNGDGRDDLMLAGTTTQNRWFVYASVGRPGTLPANYSSAFNVDVNLLGSITIPVPSDETRMAQLADLNADGLLDVIYPDVSSGTSTTLSLFVRFNRGSQDGFGPPQRLNLAYTPGDLCQTRHDPDPPSGFSLRRCDITFRSSPSQFSASDFNGDGRADVLLRVARVYEDPRRADPQSTESSFVSPAHMDALAEGTGQNAELGGDIADIHWYLFTVGSPDASGVPMQQYASFDAFEAGNYFPGGDAPYSEDTVSTPDFNGDGLNDLVYESPLSTTKFRIRINTGTGFSTSAVETPSLSYDISVERAQIFDFTGDGRADILYPPDDAPSNPTCGAQSVSNQTLAFCLIQTQATPAGLSFAPTVRLDSYLAADDGNLSAHDQLFGDFDGDGKVDYLRLARDTSPTYEILIVRDAQPHQPVAVIDGITDGMGAQTLVDYQPLTNASVYRRDPGIETPAWGRGSTVQEFLGPMYVVSQALSSTPTYANGDATATIEYRYGGARMQAGGRGFLGFRTIDTLDINPDTSGIGSSTLRGVARTEYHQDYPFVGQAKSSLSLAVPASYDFYSGLHPTCRNSPEAQSGTTCFAAFDVGWTDITSGGAIKLAEKLNVWACKGHGDGSVCPIAPNTIEATCSEVSRAVSFVPTASQQPIEPYLIGAVDWSYALNSTASSGALLSTQMGVFCHEDGDGNVTFSRTETLDATNTVLKAEETRSDYTRVVSSGGSHPKWQLGRLLNSEVKRAQGGYQQDINPVTRNVAFSYDLANDGLLRTETPQTGSDGAESVRTLYDLDAYGNRTVSYICSATRADGSVLTDAVCRNRNLIQHRPVAPDGRPTTAVHRYTRQEWDSLGRYPTISYAPFFTPSGNQVIEQATARVHSRDRMGNVTDQSDANGRHVRSGYGVLGRAYYSEVDGGGSVSTTLRWCAGVPGETDTVACPSQAVYRTAVVTSGAPTRWSYHDRLGRAVLTVTEHFDGEAQPLDQRFSAVCAFVDIKGRSERASEPFFLSQPASKDGSPAFTAGDNLCNLSDSQWTRSEYDLLSRPTKVTAPDGSQTLWRYSDFSTQQTNALGQLSESTRNALGQVIRERQANPDNGAALGLTVSYEYDLQGSLRFTRRNAGRGEIVVEQRYDSHGRLVKLIDPDRGVEDYYYNAAGELIRMVDGSNQEVLQHFDALGRRWKRVSGSPQVTDVWQYDTASHGLGALEVETRSSASEATWSRTYTFDSVGRPVNVATLLDGQTYTESSTYDSVGRPYTQTDASGKTLEQTYTIKGYPEALRDRYSRAGAYNRVRQLNARGQVTLERRGDSDTLAIRRSFDPQRGWLTGIQSGNGNALQNLGYLYNAIGRLEWREDRRIAHREDFTYDALNRLKTVQLRLNGGSPITTLNLTYDALGNLCSKNGVTYAYNGLDNCNSTGQNASASPHAVSSIGGRAHLYDGAGRMSFVTGGSPSTDRSYEYSGLGELRAARVGSLSPSAELQLRYNPEGERIKEVQTVGGQTTTTRWIGNVEFIQISTGSSTQIRRHIGGVAIESWFDSKPATLHYLFTDALGSVDTVANASGGIVERMSFDAHGNRRNTTDWQSPLGSIPTSTRQGFTGHHMLDVFGLIHMNGRVYDPQIGRFLQADVMLDAGIQGLNRYSYVLNNPLSLTDPSGHMSVGQILRTVAAIAITVYTGGWAAGYWGASLTAGQALAVMAAGGFVSGAIQSGSLKGGLTGAYTAMAFYAVGSYFQGASWASKGGKLTTIGRTAKIVAHGVVGGVSSELQGASFGSGFASAGFSELAGPLTEKLDSNLAQVTTSALIGGTASRLSGGKFANGALTGAMGWAFNHIAHSRMQSDAQASDAQYTDDGYLIGGYSPAAGDYLTTSGEVASLQVNDSGNALFDGAGNYYSHDPISGMVDRINDSPIESVYPESYVGAIGVWRIGVGLGYRTIAAITAMGSPTYGTFAAGSVARTAWKAANLSFRWLRPNTLFVSPRFYWGKAGGDFGRAITSLGHPNGVVDRALIPLAPLATGFLSD